MNFKRGLRAISQPVLLIKIQPINKHAAHSSSIYSLPKGPPSDKDGRDSVNGECFDVAEVSSFADDNVCSSLVSLSPVEATELSNFLYIQWSLHY